MGDASDSRGDSDEIGLDGESGSPDAADEVGPEGESGSPDGADATAGDVPTDVVGTDSDVAPDHDAAADDFVATETSEDAVGDSGGDACETVGSDCVEADLVFMVPCSADSEVWEPACPGGACECGYPVVPYGVYCDALYCLGPTTDWGTMCEEAERVGFTRILCAAPRLDGSYATRVGCCRRDGHVRCDTEGVEGTMWCPE